MLQEREKAKARRAKEKARARKLERQREREEAITVAEEQSDEVEDGGEMDQGNHRSHRSPDIKPPSRKPHMRAAAIDSHTNDTYCTRQITPEHSDEEPRYVRLVNLVQKYAIIGFFTIITCAKVC